MNVTVSRKLLWKAMEELEVEEELIKAENNKVSIKTGKNISDPFKTSKGLLQDCSKSSTPFEI